MRPRANIPINRTVANIAYAADVRGGTKDQRGKTARPSRFCDDLVLSAIRRVRAGESTPAVADDLCINVDTVKGWCAGINRGHLLARVEREERKAA